MFRLMTIARLPGLVLVMLCVVAAGSVLAYTDELEVDTGAHSVYSGIGFAARTAPGATDENPGGTGVVISPQEVGIFTVQHRASGFFASEVKAPIPPGGNKTWSNIYLWAQNYDVGPAARVPFEVWIFNEFPPFPTGYTAHLVLDYLPAETQWTGPMDWWLDLNVYNEVTMPIATVTNPLDGVRMHITVYAPVPEPGSLVALLAGLTGLGGVALRRRRG